MGDSSSTNPWRRRGAKLARWYRGFGLLLLNTILLFGVVNAVLYFPTRRLDARYSPAVPILRPNPASTPAEREAIARKATETRVFARIEHFYPTLTPPEVATMWVETLATHEGMFAYEPYTGFRVKPFRGRFVNVDPAGFRWGGRPVPWPLDRAALNVFVFGGSTTFGYGVADDATIPAALERLLAARVPGRAVHVYNFGRGYYFSTQERVLFERLLGDGYRPDVVVFVDGLNDFYNLTGEPENTADLARCFETSTPPSALATVGGELPMGRAATWLRERLLDRPLSVPHATAPGPGGPPAARPPRDSARRQLRRVVFRVIRNHRLAAGAASAYGIRPVFVWQPVPTYKYDLAPYAVEVPQRHERSREGYALMARIARSGKLGPQFVWCADIQEHVAEALYIDALHYSPAMSTRIAECIGEGLVRTGALVP